METGETPGDQGGYFPNLDLAKRYLNNPQTNQAIQKDRIRGIKTALNQREFKTILDFGIGDGVRFTSLQLVYEKLTGIDISKHMVNLAKKTYRIRRIQHMIFMSEIRIH